MRFDSFALPEVHFYGVMLLTAWGLGWWLARRRARRIGVVLWHIDWLQPLLLVSCGLGSRLAAHLTPSAAGWFANDRVLYGGFLMALAAGSVYAVASRIPLGRLGDAFAYSLPLGIAVLRVGCFFAGCCWGDTCVRPETIEAVDDRSWRRQVQTFPTMCEETWPLQVTYPRNTAPYVQHLIAGLLPPGAERSLPVHPVQLYETAACLLLLCGLIFADRFCRLWGESFLLCCLGYAVIRFVIEWFRADNLSVAGGLTVWQWVSLGGAGACLVVWRVRIWLTHQGFTGLVRTNG